jgi:hypothetical protein
MANWVLDVSEPSGENVGMISKYVVAIDYCCLGEHGDGGYCL